MMKWMMMKGSGLLGAAALAALAVSPASAQRGADGEVKILYWQAPSILNPYLSSGVKDVEASSVVLEPLASYDEKGEMVPRLAVEIPTLANGGFAADLGGEKFFNIVCRVGNLKPDVAVLVASIRALKMHGGMDVKDIGTPNVDFLEKGYSNLDKHIENIKKFGVPVVVAINQFPTDSPEEIEHIKKHCEKVGVRFGLSKVFTDGGKGGVELAEAVLESIEKEKAEFKVLYDENSPIKDKIRTIAKEVYGAQDVVYTGTAPGDISVIEAAGNDKLPICMAKTQLSITDDPAKKGAPKDWVLTVREVRLSAGAGFIVPLTGEMMIMPGLPTTPAAERIDIDDKGHITGLN